jgi:hypothetical protein
MTDSDLSTALSVPRSTISKWRSRGMPSSSIELARAWQEANRPHRGRKTLPDAPPLIHPNGQNPDDLADDPYSVRDRLRKAEKQISCALNSWTEEGLPKAMTVRNNAKTQQEILAAENQISQIHLTVKNLRHEHRLACKALLDSEMSIVKLGEKRGKLVTLDAAKDLISAILKPLHIFLTKLPDAAETDAERTKLTSIAEAGLGIIRESATKHVRETNGK